MRTMTAKNIENAFKPVIHREDGSYWAEIPAMPGCFTAADTLAELKGNLVEAMKCWLLTRADLALATAPKSSPVRRRRLAYA